ncbi:MAG: hypothetical protein BKP49_02535 [Treponema sp. CETP13]|nr:MAG: hypothetical protein BKP49_02535 [Treponema sp. CETP13]
MIHFSDSGPIYLQIVEDFKLQLANGTLKSGEKLPSGRDLAIQIKVNPNTVARAYQELERQGITETRRGLGTFIVENKDLVPKLREAMSMKIIDDFLMYMKAAGFSADEIPALITEALRNKSDESQKKVEEN